ncbi:MAG: protoporphyrinogen oxidase [Pirellulaceae bacterium]|nr:protoporphyrinogen oxidase [Pirellulaceae bacterium]
MNDFQSDKRRVAVIGGGISGLSAAHRIHELDPTIDLRLFESAPRLGGSLQTERRDGFLLEWGADNFITQLPWGLDLCRRIGFEDQLIPTDSAHRQAFVVSRGRLRKIPEGFVIMAPSRIWPVITTPILSPVGKLRMAWEYFVPAYAEDEDESLASFVIRRFGRETYDRLVQPLVGGIYTGDPERLSVQTTMPRFVEMERNHGSLIRAVWSQVGRKRQQQAKGSSGARYSMFVAPRDGMDSLVAAVAARLPQDAIRVGSPVLSLAPRPEGGWTIRVGGERPETIEVDGVVLAVKALAASRLLAEIEPTAAELLAEIPHASCSIVSLGYRREQIAHRMDGFGFVVPLVENRKILSGSFSSVKYPGRAPEGKVLVRAFVGGACQAELADLPDDQLIALAQEEFGQLLGIKGEPLLVNVARQPHAMPQYYVGHKQRIQQLDELLSQVPGLYFAGNAYEGVGIPQCIHSGETAAQRLVDQLKESLAARAVGS